MFTEACYADVREIPDPAHGDAAFCVVLACAVVLLALSAPADVAKPPLWGVLTAGEYRVGFRTVFLIDGSRTWKTTRPYGGPFTPDPTGRPIRVDLWYPAAKGGASRPMRFRHYVDVNSPERFRAFQTIIARRDRTIVNLDAPPENVPLLLDTPVGAVQDAPQATGRFPLILYFGGLDDAATINASVLAEFLASHGFVIASVAPVGASEAEPAQVRTPIDLEATVRDMEFAWSHLRDETFVDPARLAAIGYSVGGIEAVILAMRNPNVSAVISLDGTYHFAGAASKVLTDFYDYTPRRFRAALLDIRRSASRDIDLAPVQALRYSHRTLVALPKMHHSDFTAFAMIAVRFHLGNTPGYVDTSGWTRESGYAGYQAVCRIVLDDLDEQLLHRPAARARMTADIERLGGSIESIAAVPAPPSMREIADLMATRGFEAGRDLVKELQKKDSSEEIVDVRSCNALGYELLGEKRFEAEVAVFRLCAYTHPASANAQDSLADGYLGAGQKELAAIAYERAASLASDDPSIAPQDKRAYADAERARARQIK